MSASRRVIRRRRRRALGFVLALPLLGAALALLLGSWSSAGGGRAGAATPAGEVTPRTDDSIPAQRVTMFGASPGEAPDEAWGIGHSLGSPVVVRYQDSGWTIGAQLQNSAGAALEGFALAHPEAGRYQTPSPLAGQMTTNGVGALLGTVGEGASLKRVLLMREPGGPFQEVPEAPSESEAALQPGEKLFGVNAAPMLAALEEPGGGAGALVVPVDEGGERTESSVLHWDGHEWSREQIEVPAGSSESFTVLALGASSPGNAWLLARLSADNPAYPSGAVALFRRHLRGEGETPVWEPVSVDGGEAGGPISVPTEGGAEETFTVLDSTQSQVLTVTAQGAWLDGVRTDSQASTTMLVEPDSQTTAHVARAWCLLPASASGAPECAGRLPAQLPGDSEQRPASLGLAAGRSFAWTGGGEYGERVITGLPAGASLRLDGTSFDLVPALGGTPHHDVGGEYGAAFASAREGWLGQELLPVHLSLKSFPSKLAPWPVPFRKALLALAPEPGTPVGSVNSEALAVGDRGEVARYIPGNGWRPESLLGPGQHHETPRLRAVAWPRPGRAYAVGDYEATAQSSMWLWRSETGLWEPDPATPLNFRGNLLGIAFDPNNAARGYAVGESGVLLGYGKTWEQEPLPAEGPCKAAKGEPEEVARCANWGNAMFTSIAFAGSEAIVAYRVLLSTSSQQYRGGLLVNSGSGWRIDTQAAAAIGTATPYAVAGLPDGGAAVGVSALGGGASILERASAGAEWQATPTPFPGEAPGSLALFREGGALRAIASGTVPATARLESEQAPPAGSPPNLLPPYPVETRPEQGVLRQTATGWSDEEHELNNTKEPPGEYEHYDTVYEPDPVAAVLVNEGGTEGWAVGGFVSAHPELDTADVDRYPSDGTVPPGAESTPIPAAGANALFAIGGNAECEAPCAIERNAGLGPDRWLENAIAQSKRIGGLRAFLYTGNRVTTGRTAGPPTLAIPYREEQQRYNELLAGQKVPAVASTDLDGSGSLTTFDEAFGTSAGGGSFTSAASPSEPTVRVIVLDTHSPAGVDPGQLEEELLAAARERHAAIVIGNANLPALVAAGEGWAANVVRAMEKGDASAYFYDAPGENVHAVLEVEKGLAPLPTFGSGTLGYVNFTEEQREDFHGASGFMLAEVGPVPAGGGQAAVTVKLIPDISELALEAVDGTLLQRSQPALFAGLARRPRSGNRAHNQLTEWETDPYIPLPERCFGTACGRALLPSYTFSSSRKGFGDFVVPQLGTGNERSVELFNGKALAVKELEQQREEIEKGRKPGGAEALAKVEKLLERAETGGLFCAFNEGETVVTISAGGLAAKLPVKVERGSVRRPCGTVKDEPSETPETPVEAPGVEPEASPAASPSPLPPIPLPAPPLVKVAPPHAPAPTFFVQNALPPFIPAVLPPPLPQPARPTPPSGTSAVTQPVEAPEKEEEEEAAPESVSADATAYRQTEHEPSPAFILGVIVLAAFAGAGVKTGIGRRRRGVRVAPATINTMRAQRRAGRDRDLRW